MLHNKCVKAACACLLSADCFYHFFCIFEEFEVDEKVKELHSKDDKVAQKDKIIKVNSDVITALQKEVDSLQVRLFFCIEELLHCYVYTVS